MGKIFETKTEEVQVLKDIICDSCGNSCTKHEGYGPEFMTLSAGWGYSSGKDMERWWAYLCEKCVDEKLGFVKFKITATKFNGTGIIEPE